MQSLRGIDGITAFGVGSSVDNAPNLCPRQSPGAHHARFDGDVERAVTQILSTEGIGSCGDGLHLGMSRDIVERFGEVVSARYDAILAHYHHSHRHLVAIGSHLRLFQSAEHILFVCCHSFGLKSWSKKAPLIKKSKKPRGEEEETKGEIQIHRAIRQRNVLAFFHTQCDSSTSLVHFHHAHFYLLLHLHHFGGIFHEAIRQLRHVHQPFRLDA